MKLKSIFLSSFLAFTALSAASDKPFFHRIDNIHMNGALAAIVADNYEAFCAVGEPELKSRVDQEKFKALVSKLKQDLIGGFSAEGEAKIERKNNEMLMAWQIYVKNAERPLSIMTKSHGSGGKLIEFEIEE